jgi:hypothetical protein
MPFLHGSLDWAVAPDTPPIMVYGNSFLLVRGVHSNPLRMSAIMKLSSGGRAAIT